jgi:hypothetical protein
VSNLHFKLTPNDIKQLYPNLGKPLQVGQRSSANFTLPSHPAFLSRGLKWWSRDSARDDD